MSPVMPQQPPWRFPVKHLRSAVAGLVLVGATLTLAPAASAQQPRDSMRVRSDSGMAHMRTMRDSTDARLDSLVRAMNSATGDRKVQAMADVINEMVAERKLMHQHMQEMMPGHGGMRRHPGMGDSGMMRRRSMPRPSGVDTTAR
jgi:hypothetical protein